MSIYAVFIDGKPVEIELTRTGEGSFTVKIEDKSFNIELSADKLGFEKGFSMKINSKEYKVEMPEINQKKPFPVKVEEATFKAELKTPTRRPASAIFEPTRITPMKRTRSPKQHMEGAVTAPMTGKILSVMVKKGDQVKAGQILGVLEAMKMENEITAPKTGTVQEVYVSEDSSVSEGEALFVVS
ncbi:MAG: biotin/lipoyl-binding protein [Candidatus Bathyarchaeota archaeon]|nr:biotin/lipoyl-binding protein [Candidatus Bathyarchaeota archaeon]